MLIYINLLMTHQASAVKIHTIEQLFGCLKALNLHHGVYVIAMHGTEINLPILYPYRSDHFSFLLVKSGEIVIKVNLLEFTIQQNNVLMLSPQVVRQFVRMSADLEIITVAFTAEYLSNAGIHYKNIKAFEFLSSQVNPLLRSEQQDFSLLLKMIDILMLKLDHANERSYQEEVLSQIFGGFIYDIGSLYKKQELLEEVRGTRKEELTFRFLKLLPKHFKEKRSVKSYADLLNITPKYLSQTLKDVTGKTAGDFIEELVIMEAKILLNNPELTIGQIASYLNFSDQFIFSKYFKKQCGLTPSQYRQSA